MILKEDLTKAHMELNNDGEANQLYYVANLLTRCYLTKTLLCPERGIQEILQEFKKSIFKGCQFFFQDFVSVGEPQVAAMPRHELQSAD